MSIKQQSKERGLCIDTLEKEYGDSVHITSMTQFSKGWVVLFAVVIGMSIQQRMAYFQMISIDTHNDAAQKKTDFIC